MNDELHRKRQQKRSKNEKIRDAVKAIQQCPVKGCTKKNGHWGKHK